MWKGYNRSSTGEIVFMLYFVAKGAFANGTLWERAVTSLGDPVRVS